MLVPVSIDNGIQVKEVDIKKSSFKSLGIKESQIEDFLRDNVEVIFGDEKSLLIIGQQVKNKEKGRSDWVLPFKLRARLFSLSGIKN